MEKVSSFILVLEDQLSSKVVNLLNIQVVKKRFSKSFSSLVPLAKLQGCWIADKYQIYTISTIHKGPKNAKLR